MSGCSEEIFVESVIAEKETASAIKDKYVRHKTGNGLYQCYKCKREFTLSSNLNRHMRYNKICGYLHGFECKNCHKIFSLNATLKDHYERCIAEDPYRFLCPNCPKQFTFKSSLNKHLRGRCPNFKKPFHISEHVFKCQYCPAELYTRSALEHHENSGMCALETSPEQHTCPHCGNNFTMKSSLKKHLKGRCKVIKSKEKHLETENVKIVYVGETSNSNEEESYVYEAIYDDENIIEESVAEYEEVLPNDVEDVESYVEVSNETQNSQDEKKFKYKFDEDVASNDA